MKWTAERIEAVRTLAATGASMSKAAAKCGVSIGTIAGMASRNRIRFGQPKPAMPLPGSQQFINVIHDMVSSERDAARARWAAEMPRLRERVRAEVAAIMADARP